MNPHAFPEVWLTTLDAVKRHRGLNAENMPADSRYTAAEIDGLLTMCILDASASIVGELARLPLPYRMTATYPGSRRRVLYIEDDLLEIETLLDADGTSIAPDEYSLFPNNFYPKFELWLYEGTARPFWWTLGATTQVITLTGTFGYVPHWTRAWKPSGQVVPAGGMSAGAATLTLPSVAKFEIGAYGRIDDEYVQVTGRDDTTKTLTLARGVLGAPASAHAEGAALELFVQHADIQTKATEWAAYLYKTLEQLGEEVKVFEGGVQFVKGLSPLIRRALRRHRRL
jgi:hypothetical protein